MDSGLRVTVPHAPDTHWSVRVDDLADPQTIELLRLHLEGMHASSPACHVHALDLSGLKVPEVTVWSVWDHDHRIGAIGALKALPDGSGEVKSMRTHPDQLRRGAAATVLERIIETARHRGYHRLSLETGRGAAFEPALAMYRKRGFHDGDAFADYRPNDFSQFLHLQL